ncbi:hypothetical protein GCT13_38670 [Paraburkholderia sp. CNPSo 3157]|uniref:Uncharacterized protein n=1 Tax=Paraburkholderia franconis TaxID=2654983 RepID=A0A7X1TKF6_9BURK|nr:hypothetical protein [Paraburkholderia franconis]MPW22590.1 hypothetical protein [Paraburkholderia franconis]
MSNAAMGPSPDRLAPKYAHQALLMGRVLGLRRAGRVPLYLNVVLMGTHRNRSRPGAKANKPVRRRWLKDDVELELERARRACIIFV